MLDSLAKNRLFELSTFYFCFALIPLTVPMAFVTRWTYLQSSQNQWFHSAPGVRVSCKDFFFTSAEIFSFVSCGPKGSPLPNIGTDTISKKRVANDSSLEGGLLKIIFHG